MHVRDRIKLSDEEVRALLDECDKLVVATVGPGGQPHLSMLHFALVDDRVAFTTYRSAQKVVNMTRDPRVTCMAETGEGYYELRSAVLYGRAVVDDDPQAVFRVGRACAGKLGSGSTENADDAIRRAMRKRVAVFVDVDRVVSWDHRKLPTANEKSTDGLR